jgi:hypothetical protein
LIDTILHRLVISRYCTRLAADLHSRSKSPGGRRKVAQENRSGRAPLLSKK